MKLKAALREGEQGASGWKDEVEPWKETYKTTNNAAGKKPQSIATGSNPTE